IPDSYLEASQDLGAKGSRTLRSVILPLAIPGIVAGSIFTFSLTLGDFITPALVGGAGSSFIGNIVEEKVGQPDIPFAAAFATVPVVVLGVATVAVIAFLWLPLLLIMAYAFNSSTIQSWPISGFTFHWFRQAWDDHEVRSSLSLSLKVGLAATAIALVLGTAAAAAIYRFRFFGREA